MRSIPSQVQTGGSSSQVWIRNTSSHVWMGVPHIRSGWEVPILLRRIPHPRSEWGGYPRVPLPHQDWMVVPYHCPGLDEVPLMQNWMGYPIPGPDQWVAHLRSGWGVPHLRARQGVPILLMGGYPI